MSTSRRASTSDAADAYWRRLGCRQDPCATLAPGSVFAGPGFVQLQHALFKALRTSPGGLTLLTGAEGVGKTTLLQTIVDALRTVGETVIFHRCGPDRQLLEADLAAVADDRGKRNPILMLDGADAWDDAAIAAFERALTRAEGPPLSARIVVVFRQDNDPRVNRVTSLALASGIPFARLRVEPLESGSTGDFLLHRMRAAGYMGGLPLDPATTSRIEAESGGLPSRLLVLASVELARIAEQRTGRGAGQASRVAGGADFSTMALRLAVGAAALAALVGGGAGLLMSSSVRPDRNDATASAAMRPPSSPAPASQAATPLAVAPITNAPPPVAQPIAASSPPQAPSPPTAAVAPAPAYVEPTLAPLTGATPLPPQGLPRDVRGALEVLEHTADAVLAPASGPTALAPPAIIVSSMREPDDLIVTSADEDESVVARVIAVHEARREAPVVVVQAASAPPAPAPAPPPIVVETLADPSLEQVVVQPVPVLPPAPPPVVVIRDPAADASEGEGVVVHIVPAAGWAPLVTEDPLPPAEGVVVQAPPPAPVVPPPPPPPPVVTAPHFDPPPPVVVIVPPPPRPQPPAPPAATPPPPVVPPPPSVVVAPTPPQPPPPQAVPAPPPPAAIAAPIPAAPPTPQPPPAAVAPPPVVIAPAPPAPVVPPPPAPPVQRSAPSPSPAAVAQAIRDLERGEAMLATGDVASARLFFERAANAGNRRAMTALARTYDPDVLRQLGVVGLTPDPQRAQFWYRRAAEPTR